MAIAECAGGLSLAIPGAGDDRGDNLADVIDNNDLSPRLLAAPRDR
jgi:hypothetical protein